MEEVESLSDHVHRLNSSLSGYQHENPSQSTSQQAEKGRWEESSASWILDRGVTAPLIREYDQHMTEMTEQLQTYQTLMAEIKVKLERVVKENERLHAELKLSVQKQLDALPAAPGVECSVLEDEAIVRNLQEQVQLSEQERLHAVELWQTAEQQLDCLQQEYQKTISDKQSFDAQTQQLKNQLAQFQQHIQKLLETNQRLEKTNQHILKTVTEQNKEIEELHSQLRQAKAELRMATTKVDEMTKLLHTFQDQMKTWEEDVSKAQGRESAAERRVQQLQASLSQMEARLKAASQESEAVGREQTVWERKVGKLQACCTILQKEKFEALARVRECVQAAEEVTLQKDQALVREKQRAEELEKTKEGIKLLIQDAALRTRKQVDHMRKQCNFQIHRMAEELSALQLESADKESQLERSSREKRTLEEELEKVYKEGRAEPEFGKIRDLHQRCLDAERIKEDICLSLQSAQSKMKKMELTYSEELSRCQEEVRRLQDSLAKARDNCVCVNEERLKLQQENLHLTKEMDELRKASLQAQKKAKQQVLLVEQEYNLRKQELEARMQELDDYNRSSNGDLTRLLTVQQKTTQHWKEEAQNMVQAFETKVSSIKAELNRQKKHSYKLDMELETERNTVTEYKRQLSEYQEKMRLLQARLTQAEQRATAAAQLTMKTFPQKKTDARPEPDAVTETVTVK